MQRTEADVVKKTLAVLDEYDRDPAAINELDISTRVASRVILKKLTVLLAQFKDSPAIATPTKFKILEDFLRKWNRLLIGTPLDSSHLAIKACIALAEDLAPVFQYRALDLLLPKVIIPEGFQTKHYNNFVVTDDGYLIGVVEGLDAVRQDKNHLFLHPVSKKEMDPDLLMEHSSAAWEYAAKIRNLCRPKPIELADCDKARTALEKVINDNEVKVARLKPAHKAAGQKQLMRALTKKIHSLTELAEFLDDFVPKNEWAEFLHNMDREELCRIVITKRHQSAQKKDQPDKDYKEEQAILAFPALTELASSVIRWPASDNAKRILVYILAFLGHELRSDGPEFYKAGRGWFAGMTGQTSKTEVLKQLKAMQDFMLTDEEKYKDMRDIEKYFADKGIVLASTTCTHIKAKIIDAGRQCAHEIEEKPASVAVEQMDEQAPATAPGLSQ